MSFALSDRDFCLQKIDSTISLVERLLDGEYPHNDSIKALRSILAVHIKDRALLRSLNSATQNDTILEYCRRVNISIVKFKLFLGLLIRSSNIRNAFEIYFPTKILAVELLEKPTSVVLSSEWDFSPFTYPLALPELPNFIFIGIPASECHNPLILPLAGHELGHVVWQRKGARQEFDPVIRTRILELYRQNWEQFTSRFGGGLKRDRLETDLFLRGIWAQSYKIAQRQLEEVFCDYVGLFVFGQAFLYSFRYLLAPSLGRIRVVTYPKIRDRAKYMADAAKEHGLVGFDDFSLSFSEQDQKFSPNDEFILEMADTATRELHPQLIGLVEKYRGSAEKFTTGTDEEERARACLLNLVPAASVKSIAAIVNAAWAIRLDLGKWHILKDVKNNSERRSQKLRVLRDLVLKSFEVYEYRKRLEKYAP